MSPSKIIFIGIMGLSAAFTASCIDTEEPQKRPHPSVVHVVSEASQEQWLARRQAAMLEAEAQVAVLLEARQELQGRKLGIQRDAAICLETRHITDRTLRAAMQAKGEFGPALDE